MTHFVYVYSAMTPVWDELRYSCLSIQKHYQGKWKIFIIGDKPAFRGPYTYIPHKGCTHKLHAKAFDAVAKLKVIAEHPDINEEFVYMYDDQIFLRSLWWSFINQPLAHEEIKGDPRDLFKHGRIPSGRWKNLFFTTFDTLRAAGLPTWNYETHSPKVYSKTKILEVIEKFHPDKVPMLFNSLYFNYVFEKPYATLKQKPLFMASIHNPRPLWWIKEKTDGRLILNYDDIGLNKHLKQFIQEHFKKNQK